MRLLLALIAAFSVFCPPAFAAGLEESMRAAGFNGGREAPVVAPRAATGDLPDAFVDALWERERIFADAQHGECRGQPGCGKQVSARWLVGRQATAVSRALERLAVRRSGLRRWGNLMRDSGTAAQTSLAVAAGTLLLFSDGIHTRTVAAGLRFDLDLAALRRLRQPGQELAKLEVGPAGNPFSLSVALGRRAPMLGLGCRLRY